MVVGLLLKSDVEVDLEAIAVFGEQEEPFEHKPQIEADVEQFTLLGCVDAHVVEFRGIELLHGEDNAKEIDGIEAAHESHSRITFFLAIIATSSHFSKCFRLKYHIFPI